MLGGRGQLTSQEQKGREPDRDASTATRSHVGNRQKERRGEESSRADEGGEECKGDQGGVDEVVSVRSTTPSGVFSHKRPILATGTSTSTPLIGLYFYTGVNHVARAPETCKPRPTAFHRTQAWRSPARMSGLARRSGQTRTRPALSTPHPIAGIKRHDAAARWICRLSPPHTEQADAIELGQGCVSVLSLLQACAPQVSRWEPADNECIPAQVDR